MTTSPPMLVAADPATSIRIVGSVREIDALRPAWEELAARCPLPTALPEWTTSAFDAFAQERRVAIVLVEDAGGALRALAPLATAGGRGGRYVPLGGPELGEPTDLLFADEDALARLAGVLAAQRMTISLERVPVASPAIPALQRAYGSGVVVVKPSPAGAPTLALTEAWTGPQGALTGRRAQDVRRARRRAEALGAVDVTLTHPSAAEVPDLLTRALVVEDHGWKGRAGTSLARDRARRRFICELVEHAATGRRVQVGLLTIAGEAAAMQIALEHAGSLWLVKVGYDERFARCSPGSLLLLECLRDAAARGLRSLEFMGRREAWTDAWTREERPMCAVRAYPRSPTGLLTLGTDTADRARRRLAERRTSR